MGVMSDIAGALGLSADINKAKGRSSDELSIGAVSDLLPELTLNMDNEKLIQLTDKWKDKWETSKAKADWLKMSEENEKYWKGKHFNKLETEFSRPMMDNIVFEGTETFLPAATRQNPEPLVELKATEEKNEVNLKYAEIIRNKCADWADESKLRLKIKKAGRHWFISLLGVGKIGWDLENNRPALKIIRPQKLVLDPDGTHDEDGYTGKYIGEVRKLEASRLVKIISDPEAVTAITEEVKGEMGTDVQFIEWWTRDYMCWTMDKHVLLKKMNPHWNYSQEELAEYNKPAPMSGELNAETGVEPTITLNPNPQEPSITTARIPSPFMPPQPGPPPQNHFAGRRMPYVFLTIFNLGKSPTDENSLITQVLPQQDITNKRLKQIDGNVDTMNNGMVISETRSGLTRDEAKQVSTALKKGGTVVIPDGNPNEAIARFPATALPSDVFNNMVDQRNRFREILGITGLTPAGIKNEDTVGGKIITRGLDTDRIGGGITEYFEQFADDIYNWVVQMYYVYDDILAKDPSIPKPKLRISVKEGSLLPKDATTKANQAIELASAGKMSLVDLYKALEYPDPEQMAANVWLERTAPHLLFIKDERVKQVMQAMSQQKQAEQKPVSKSISFKDLPPEGQTQLAEQAGIKVSPAEMEAKEIKDEAKEVRSETRRLASSAKLGANKNQNVRK